MSDYMTPADRLRACGEALYGSTWQSELARELGLSVESGVIRKMASGRSGITAHNWSKIAGLMDAKRARLLELIPAADPQSGTALAIREALRCWHLGDDSPLIAGGCLIGIGHYDLGQRLIEAHHQHLAAMRRLSEVEMRQPTEDEVKEHPLWAYFEHGIAVDPDAYDAAWADMIAAKNHLGALTERARAIADALDHGYDGAPS